MSVSEGIYPSDLPAAAIVDAVLGIVNAGGVTDLRRVALTALVGQVADLISTTAFGGATHSSVELGLDHTSSTQFFAVPGGAAGEGLTIYKNALGVAIEVATLLGTNDVADIVDQIASLETAVSGATSMVGTLGASLEGEAATRATTDAQHAGQIASLETAVSGVTSMVGTLGASLEGEASTRATTDAQHAGQIASLETAVSGVTSMVGTLGASLEGEASTRATTDAQHAGQISVLETAVSGVTSMVGTLGASLEGEASTRAMADAAQADAIAGLATTRERTDAALLSANTGRPGEGHTASRVMVGPFEAALSAAHPDAWTIVDPVLGSAIEITGARVDPVTGYVDICAVDRVAIETGHVYVAEWRLRQTLDPVDPIGDAVRIGIAWLTASKALLSAQVVGTFDLLVADGVRHVTTTIGRTAGDGIDIVAPAGSVYAALWARRYGTTGTTILSVLRLRDGWAGAGSGGAGDPDGLADEIARATAAEGDLADRIAALETVSITDLVVVPTIAEMGASVTPALSWTLTGTADVASLKVGTTAVALDATAWTAPAAIIADTTYTVTVTDTLGRASSATAAVDFRARVYWGASASAALASAGIIALASSALATSRARSMTINASGGKYVYCAYPASMGEPSDVTLYGFSVHAEISTLSVTTAAGYTADYYVIRSADLLTDASVALGVA